jgi:hypothetical protein
MASVVRYVSWIAAAALASASCSATTVVETTMGSAAVGAGGAASGMTSTGAAVTTAATGGGFCSWVTQSGTKIECAVDAGTSCPAPAGPNWCSVCACKDPVTNLPACTQPACIIDCPVTMLMQPSGGCLLTYGMCNDERVYQVTCPGPGQPCQCHFRPRYGKDEYGAQTPPDLCKLPPVQQLEAVNEACQWQLHVKN